jgi:hypothetical protein
MTAAADTDEELSTVRAHASAWAKAWKPDLPLRKLMYNLQDPDFVAALDAPRDEVAEPVRVNLDLPTRPDRLTSPLAQLQGLEFMAQMIERTKVDVVAECRQRGWSWGHIGEALGVARQSAWMKYAVAEDD